MTALTYYPGCSLKTSSKFYETSIKNVFSSYGIEIQELPDWSCCGASAAHTVDDRLAHALVARNLALAEKRDYHMFAPCSACYIRSKTTNERIRQDKAFREDINNVIFPLKCLGTGEVKNIIEVLHDHVGIELIARRLKYDLSALKVVPYYGCVLTRVMGMEPFDDKENPTSMDSLLWALGVELIDWPYKMECCGASKTLTNKDVTCALSGKIMDRAALLGADAVVTPCPLCQLNLDLLPYLGRIEKTLPILFLSEVFELALFGRLTGGNSHVIAIDEVVKKVTQIE
jgi:heterodisulfide reductase subunit B2